MHIDRIDHLVLTVRDIEATCAFCARVLGMEVVTFGEGRLALQFERRFTQKTYLAVVHGVPDRPGGEVRSYLAENRALKVYSTDDPGRGRLAITGWRVLASRGGRRRSSCRCASGSSTTCVISASVWRF